MADVRIQSSAWLWKTLLSLLVLCSSINGICANPMASSSDSKVEFPGMFDSIYQFGDGFSDTGNMHIKDPSGYGSGCSHAPYGETLSGDPTGRCSDGLLMVDFFARAFNLPLLEPYLAINDANFTHGVNFAYDGAIATTAVPEANLRYTLSLQLQWFRNYLNSTCSSPFECKKKLEKSLFVVGGIGANDYRLALDLEYGKSMQRAHNLVPEVVQTITNTAKEVIKEGAVNVVVPGLLPLGCMPDYQKYYSSRLSHEYDNLGCQKPQNELARIHNEHLQQSLKQLQKEYPNVAIYYGDYYKAFTWLLQNAVSLGFEKDAAFKQCCDGPCGFPHGKLCPDPKKRISWDGIHLTQEAYRNMAQWLLSDMFSHTSSTSSSPPHSGVDTISPSPSPSHTSSSSISPSPSPSHSGAHMISMVLFQAVVASILTFWTIGSKLL